MQVLIHVLAILSNIYIFVSVYFTLQKTLLTKTKNIGYTWHLAIIYFPLGLRQGCTLSLRMFTL